jgi:F0F1-type ATP synthase beta subunit
MAKVLAKAIDVPVEDEALSGIQSSYSYCIKKIFSEDSVKNGFVFVPIKWNYIPNMDDDESEEREMEISQLLNPTSKYNHIILLGGAGCGKSTSIDYLVYKNAKKWKADK